MTALAQITTATFSDGTTIVFDGDDFVVLVVPNNSGKSASLRDIRDHASGTNGQWFAVKQVAFRKEGTVDELGDNIRGGIRFSTSPTDQEEPSSSARFYWLRESIESLAPYR